MQRVEGEGGRPWLWGQPRGTDGAGKLEVTLWGAWGRALGSQPEPGEQVP